MKRKVLSVMSVFVLLSCAQAASPGSTSPLPSARPFSPPPSWAVYLGPNDYWDKTPWFITRLSSFTLADLGEAWSGTGHLVVSADARTAVEMSFNSDNTAQASVLDPGTGVPRRSFESAYSAGPVLTADGKRLLVTDSTGYSYRVYNTADGNQTGALQTSDVICCGLFPEWLDPTGDFLYGMSVPGSGLTADGPGTPVLVRYDLHYGKANGRLVLTGVQAGVWGANHKVGTEPLAEVLEPGVALSPDGSRLAVLYQDGSRLMTIDTKRMAVLSSRSLSAPSARDFFGIAPIDAYAKAEEGTSWSLNYSPDGRQLLASARQSSVDANGRQQELTTDLLLIDAGSARLLAVQHNLDVGQAFFSPDGSAIYAVRWISGSSAVTTATELLRLDANNLSVAARRTVAGSHLLLILAS